MERLVLSRVAMGRLFLLFEVLEHGLALACRLASCFLPLASEEYGP